MRGMLDESMFMLYSAERPAYSKRLKILFAN
jgi:hypothetical protein